MISRPIKKTTTLLSWRILFLVTILAAYLYIFNEWLYAVTKPSFMNYLRFPQQLVIFLSISALLTSLCLLLLLPLYGLGLLPAFKQYRNRLIRIGAFLPAFLLAALLLIMLDNFTYTIFRFGIVTSEGLGRALYGIGFLLAVFICYRQVILYLEKKSNQKKNRILTARPVYLFLGTFLLLSPAVLAFPDQTRASSLPTESKSAEQLPHILLITSDGVNASHMSVYGYERDTTPHMRELAETSLVAENNFANAAKTAGSVISIYTGKYPATTRALFPPDMLNGQDAYEHLPGILHALGYRTVQITVPYYLDANGMNLLDGFDVVKMSNTEHTEYYKMILKVMPSDRAIFTDQVLARILFRLRHIFLIEKMINPYFVVSGMPDTYADMERLESLKQELRTAGQPLFVHVHLMITHGPNLHPLEQKFSLGKSIEERKAWDDDLYDDTLLGFDKIVGDLLDTLKELDLMDETILVLGSDHGENWTQLQRLPLILHFPQNQYAGRINANVQNLDIAPTLLDYLGVEKPGWMSGKSLLEGEPGQRPILGVDPIQSEEATVVEQKRRQPPFYQFGSVSLIYCQDWFELDLTDGSWETGAIQGSTTSCPPGDTMSEQQAYHLIVEHLQENGFDVSSFGASVPSE